MAYSTFVLESKVTVLYTYTWQAGRAREGKESGLVYIIGLVPQTCVLFLIK